MIGTYPHGPVLARNPALADHVLELALGQELRPLPRPEIDELRRQRLAAVRRCALTLARPQADLRWLGAARAAARVALACFVPVSAVDVVAESRLAGPGPALPGPVMPLLAGYCWMGRPPHSPGGLGPGGAGLLLAR